MKLDLHRILIVARGGIGNVLMFTPTLKLLGKRLQNSDIYMLVDSKVTSELLSNYSIIKEFILYDQYTERLLRLSKLIVMIRRIHFDLAIVMYPGGMRSALLTFLSGAKIRIGFDIPLLRKLGSFLYTHPLKLNDKLHDVEKNIKILGLLGIDRDNEDINMTMAIPEYLKKSVDEYLSYQGIKYRENIIGFHPGSNPSQKWKRWPAHHYAELINLIYSNWETPVLIFGDHSEKILVNRIISTLNKDVTVIPVIDKNITDVAALISICKAFIGNDSGLMHIAAATDVPTFCIAGPTDVNKTGPYGPNSYIVHSNLECLFCYDFNTVNFSCPLNIDYKCLKEFYPEEVFKKISPALSNILV